MFSEGAFRNLSLIVDVPPQINMASNVNSSFLQRISEFIFLRRGFPQNSNVFLTIKKIDAV